MVPSTPPPYSWRMGYVEQITILLVDDNLTFLSSVRKFLAQLPEVLIVGEAHDGQEALTLAARERLDNLIWVWDTNAPRATPGDEAGAYEDFYPGGEYVDVLAADVYHKDWKQSHHDDLAKLAAGKPIALGEVGDAPSPELLERQPQWSWFMPWFLQARNPDALRTVFADKRVLTKDDVVIDAEGNIAVRQPR